jgi:hypothetical protein
MRGANVERGACFRYTPWADLKGLLGARGFEFKAVTNDAYTKAYSCELVRLEPGDHSVPQIEPGSHLLYILSNPGNMSGKTMDGCKAPVTSQSTAAPLQSGAAPPVKYAQARNTRRVILVTIAHFGYLRSATRAKEGLRP